MWRPGLFKSEHDKRLEAELRLAQAELKATRDKLRLASDTGQRLGLRVVELESELRGIHWVLERFFSQTPFWRAMQHFIGHQAKGQVNDRKHTACQKTNY